MFFFKMKSLRKIWIFLRERESTEYSKIEQLFPENEQDSFEARIELITAVLLFLENFSRRNIAVSAHVL